MHQEEGRATEGGGGRETRRRAESGEGAKRTRQLEANELQRRTQGRTKNKKHGRGQTDTSGSCGELFKPFGREYVLGTAQTELLRDALFEGRPRFGEVQLPMCPEWLGERPRQRRFGASSE